MESIYYEIAIYINKILYEDSLITYQEYLKKEKELIKEIYK